MASWDINRCAQPRLDAEEQNFMDSAGIAPATFRLQSGRSTTEPRAQSIGLVRLYFYCYLLCFFGFFWTCLWSAFLGFDAFAGWWCFALFVVSFSMSAMSFSPILPLSTELEYRVYHVLANGLRFLGRIGQQGVLDVALLDYAFECAQLLYLGKLSSILASLFSHIDTL